MRSIWASHLRKASYRAFVRDQRGSTLVEFAIVTAVFLLIFFGLIDFGRLGYSWVMAEKAMQRAARVVAVRPPACLQPDGSPMDNNFTANPEYVGLPKNFGSSCSNADGSGNSICSPQFASCTGLSPEAVADVWDEIWPSIAALMPSGATKDNLRLIYTFDPNLGFLGGPYVPVVTAKVEGVTFNFTSPLGGLARLAGAAGATDFGAITLPAMSVSLPGEDLAQGNEG